MHSFLKLFLGKRTYTVLAVALAKQIAELSGVQIAEEQLSGAIDVILLLLAGFFRSKAQPVDASKLPQ